jgi:hypothetical protein
MSYQTDYSEFDEMTDAEFLRRNKEIFYKSYGSQVGKGESKVENKSEFPITGKFTNHLGECGMYRDNGLHTTVDKDRYMEGSKDWMDKLSG